MLSGHNLHMLRICVFDYPIKEATVSHMYFYPVTSSLWLLISQRISVKGIITAVKFTTHEVGGILQLQRPASFDYIHDKQLK
jgi:hypothetical protein